MLKEEQRFVMKFLWLKRWGAKRIQKELMSTLGDDSYGALKSKSGFRSSGTVIILQRLSAFRATSIDFGAAT
jgi:hypothetical protein